MDNLIFAINAVGPIILVIVVGFALKKLGFFTKPFLKTANRFCFYVCLPTLLFVNLYKTESLRDINWPLMLFAVLGLVGAFIFGLVIALTTVRQHNQKGVVWQATFRSNFAFIGVPLAMALFGEEGGAMVGLLSAFCIPLFNIFSIVALALFSSNTKFSIKKVLTDIAKNPLIIGIAVGLLVLATRELFFPGPNDFRLSSIEWFYKGLTNISVIATPLALLILGGQFEFKAVKKLVKPIVITVACRNIIVPSAVLFVAFGLVGFRDGAGFAGLISLFASPVAVSSAIMAGEMGGDEELAGQLVVWSSILSMFTIFAFIVIFRAAGVF